MIKQLEYIDIDRLNALMEAYKSEPWGDSSGLARDAVLVAESLHFSGIIKKDLEAISSELRDGLEHPSLVPLYIIFAKAFVFGRRYQHSLDEASALALKNLREGAR
ncbi:MAG: hypothetical protein KGL39_28830 [Patescibacteria group bacterium]|nr:hypothetical protein [Patescibacteria group bacterium]